MNANDLREKLRYHGMRRMDFHINGDPSEPCIEIWMLSATNPSFLLLEELDNGEAEIYLPKFRLGIRTSDSAKFVLSALSHGIPF